MKDGIAAHSLVDEYFVIKIDGRAKSHHRRFLDALRAGLLLREQFPDHDVKLCDARSITERRLVMH
jgi:hypothetical protein